MPSSVCVGGMRTSTMTMSGSSSSHRGEQPAGVAERRDDLVAVLGEQAGDALAQQHRVLGDHDAHGSSATIIVGPPSGLAMRSRPSTAVTRSRRPRQPAAADARPPRRRRRRGSRRAASPIALRHVDRRVAGVAVLGDVGERLGDDEVGGGLDRRRRAVGERDVDLDRHRAAGGERRQRGVEPTVGQHRRVDAAHEVAQLADRQLGLLVGADDQLGGAGRVAARLEPLTGHAEVHRQRDEALLGAVVEVALDAARARSPRLRPTRRG